MKTLVSISTLTVFALFIFACQATGNSDAGESSVGDNHAHISNLGESSIGPKYRQKRYKDTLTITDKIGDDDDDNEDDDAEEDDDDGDADESDDDEDESDEDSSVRKNVKKLQSAKKSLKRYVREDSALNKLMSESSALAKEAKAVLHKMAKREAGLERELESLKEALNGAVITLKNSIREDEEAEKLAKEQGENEVDVDGDDDSSDEGEKNQVKKRSRRHFHFPKSPYKACVEIERISEDEYLNGGAGHQSSLLSNSQFRSKSKSSSFDGEAPNLAMVREFIPSHTRNVAQTQYSGNQASSSSRVQSQSSNSHYSHDMMDYSHQHMPPPQPRAQYQQPPVPRPLPMMPQPAPYTQVKTSETRMEYHSGQDGGNNARPVEYHHSERTYQVPSGARNMEQHSSSRMSQTQYESSGNQNSGYGQASEFQASGNRQYAQGGRASNEYQSSQFQGSSNANSYQQVQSQSSSQGIARNENHGNMNDVDLSEVYWLRLDPKRKQEILHDRLNTLLKEKQHQGKDVLVIPVNHRLKDTEDVKNGFLRAVRVRPRALDHKLFRKLRSLQVHEL